MNPSRFNVRIWVLGALMLIVLASIACGSNPPASTSNLCSILAEKSSWRRAANKARKKWQMPVWLGMAFIHRESSFVAKAKPPRNKVLWVFPGRRASSAYGYAQATDEAWKDYKKATGGWFKDRDDMSDALDFIGWYNDRSHRKLKISKNDTYHLYIAYYAGVGGYASGKWRRHAAVKSYAAKAASVAKQYQRQLARC